MMPRGRWGPSVCLMCAAACVVTAEVSRVRAHGSEARYVEVVSWPQEHIARVLGVSRSELGLPGTKRTIEQRRIGGRSCLVGALVAFDIDDRYAFDIDEPVSLTVAYATELTAPFAIGWDRNGGAGFGVTDEITPAPGGTFGNVTVTLDRARLAGRGVRQTDVAIGGRGGIALCDIALERSGTTTTATAFGRLQLEVRGDQSGAPVPARVGIYDDTGRAPLPSDEALLVHRFTDEIRLLRVNDRTFWPSSNRLAFYTNGRYDTRLPVGAYELVVTRGPEYRSHRTTVDIPRDATSTVTVDLERYTDLPARGWFSGDSHIHLMRDEAADLDVWGQVAAEDLYVGNLLEMGNIAGTHFKQSVWGAAGRFEHDGRVLVSGQEDPRTGQRGHTIHWNIQRPVHYPDAFFRYHEIFENTRDQGGVTGYAHWGGLFNGPRGLALDVPFGLVDFIEVLQGGRLDTESWYNFLNLGYQLLPVGGADFPYFGPTLPGVERTYVKVDGPFSADAWFSAFRDGHVYVTNGPFLEFTINGRQMGEELHVARGAQLEIDAEAWLNPELDQLERVELVVLGDVAAAERARGQDRIRLRHEMTAQHSMWIAIRAWGQRQDPRNMTVAHTAPVYVVVDDQPTWKTDAVPELVAHHRSELQDLLSAPVDPQEDLETWETATALVDEWERQRPLLGPRVDEANRRYQALLDRARELADSDGR